MKKFRETGVFLLLLILGLAPRLALISRYPTIPVSDFGNIIAFGLYLRDHGLTAPAWWFWQGFHAGVPVVLSGLFRIYPCLEPASLARFATAFATGLLAILPFIIWRGVLSLRLRLMAGAALALWPGQVMFSGVVAQDNWVILPSIALGALAVRALVDEKRAWPVTAALLCAAAVSIRSEMLFVLLPLLLAAIRMDLLRTRWRPAVAGSVAAILALLGLAAYRHASSGHFSLSPQHAGVSVLGAYLPGSSVNGWEPPYAFISSVKPEMLRDRQLLFSQSSGLAVREALRRPGFHVLRIIAMVGTAAIESESASLYWSLGYSEAVPPALRDRSAALVARLSRPLRIELAAIQALFLAAVIVGFRRRNRPILILASAVLVKYFLHAFGVIQGRYFMVATALELLTIAVAVEEMLTPSVPGRRSLLARALPIGAAFGLCLYLFTPALMAFVHDRDIDLRQLTYNFFLEPPDHGAELECTMDRGRLAVLWPPQSATIRTLQPDPAPGDKAVAICELTRSGEPRPLLLQVQDSYAPGGLGGRMVQRVEIDGAEVFSHDIAREPGSGWANIPLGSVGTGIKKKVVIEVDAIQPEPGRGWGDAGQTTFQLTNASVSAVSDLAWGKPASQSSTLADYPTAGAQAAVDGRQDGNFYSGSVTSTNLDGNAWWQVDLGASQPIASLVIWNRTDCCPERLNDFWVFVSNTPYEATDTPATLKRRAQTWSTHQTATPSPSTKITTSGARGRYLRVQLNGRNYLSLAEVEVFGK